MNPYLRYGDRSGTKPRMTACLSGPALVLRPESRVARRPPGQRLDGREGRFQVADQIVDILDPD